MLREIVKHKRTEVEALRKERPLRIVDLPTPANRDFEAALSGPRMSVIAEFKRRSPSKGLLREQVDIREIVAAYRDHGAAALSILTDEKYFGGSARDLREARAVAILPVLRKDFVVDEYQVYESAIMGADAILLIARILSDGQMANLLDVAERCNLAAFVETHDENEVDRAVDANARIIGVNSRDLDTFEVSLDTALRLRAKIPAGCVAVAESGIRTRQDVERLQAAGYDAMLVGEALLCAADPGQKLAELLGRAS